MKRPFTLALALLLAVTPLCARQKAHKSVAPAAAPAASTAQSEKAGGSLEQVLNEMDDSAARFHSAEADFEWDQYQKVVDETDVQKGKSFFVRHERDTHMAAFISTPEPKQITYDSGKIKLYQPKIDQITEYDAGKSKEEVESFLVLGFGGRGHDLVKSFEVKFVGYENVDGVKTAKLELVPKAEKVKSMFTSFIMWVDTNRDVSLKQQAFEPSGDYRIAKYTNVKLNAAIPNDTFKIKTTGKTKVVRPQ